jgi:hypothetical protein
MVVGLLPKAALWSSNMQTPSCMPLVSGRPTFVDEIWYTKCVYLLPYLPTYLLTNRQFYIWWLREGGLNLALDLLVPMLEALVSQNNGGNFCR